MISRRILSVSIALAISGAACFAAVANEDVKQNTSLKSRLARLEAKQRKLEAQMAQSGPDLVVPTAAEKGHAGESPDHPAPHTYSVEAITYFGGTPVVTSPYLGLRSEFDGSDLISNLSSMNEDMRLLLQRRAFDLELLKRGKKVPEFPLIELSGKIEGIANFQDPYVGPLSNDVDLETAELDVAGYFAKSILGFMAFRYDGTTGEMNRRVDNSRIYLDKAFLTLGDLTRTPLYATIGQLYVPFGRYSGFMISPPLPMLVARTKERAVVVGFKQDGDNGAFGQAYYFKGDAQVHGRNNGGVNIGYDFSNTKFHGTVSTGLINNIADSQGLQNGGGSGFVGFASSDNRLVRDVHGWAINGKIGIGSFAFVAEYVTALSDFDENDLAFNGVGARPSAFDVEAAYMFTVHEKPTNIAIGYGQTRQSLVLNVPREQYTVALNTSIWKDTIQSLEYRHDKNSAAGSTAFGRGGDVPFPSSGLGECANTVTMKVGAYF